MSHQTRARLPRLSAALLGASAISILAIAAATAQDEAPQPARARPAVGPVGKLETHATFARRFGNPLADAAE